VPLLRTSAFGRGYLDLELTLALFALAAAVCTWVDRPERPQRSVAELLALTGALLAAAACLVVPGAAGHPAQPAARGLSLALGGTMLLAAVNLSRTRPRLAAAATRPTLAAGAAVLLRRLVSGEVVLVFGALFAAGLLSSLAPPSKALARLGHVNAKVGPGRVSHDVTQNGYHLAFDIDPNRAALPNTFPVKITRG